MARTPGGNGGSADTDDDDIDIPTRRGGTTGGRAGRDDSDDDPDIPTRRGGTADGGRAGRDDGDDVDIPTRRGGTAGGGRAGRDDTGPPEPDVEGDIPTRRRGTAGGGRAGRRDMTDDEMADADRERADSRTTTRGTRTQRRQFVDPDDEVMGTDATARRALAADVTGAFRAARADPGRRVRRRVVAGGRQAARAVGATPGGLPVDPVAEVDRVSEALDEAFISRDPTTGEEFGADVEGFDEVGSGPFDLPDDFGGRTQERIQREISERLEFTEPFAEGAEDVRQDIVDRIPVGGGTVGGVATAAAAGVVAPEPVTTVGGAAVLGGLAVGGIAFDVARREGVIEIPDDGELFGGSELEPEGTATAGETRLVIPEEQNVAEIPVPESGAGLERPEVPVPDQPISRPGEIGIPEVAASQFAQGVRQRQRQERQRERGIFQRDRPGASQEELDEILRGPDEDVLLGEETPPGEEVADQTGREFFGERDTDPRVVVPEETTGEISDLADEATTPELDVDVGVRAGPVESPLIVFGQEQVPDVTSGVGTSPDVDVGQRTDQVQTPVVSPDVVPDVARVTQPTRTVTPTDPGFADPTVPLFEEVPSDPGFGEPGRGGVDPVERQTLTDIPEVVEGDRRDRRRGEFQRLFEFGVADVEAVLGGADDVPDSEGVL